MPGTVFCAKGNSPFYMIKTQGDATCLQQTGTESPGKERLPRIIHWDAILACPGRFWEPRAEPKDIQKSVFGVLRVNGVRGVLRALGAPAVLGILRVLGVPSSTRRPLNLGLLGKLGVLEVIELLRLLGTLGVLGVL